jgi:hypothetical protein
LASQRLAFGDAASYGALPVDLRAGTAAYAFVSRRRARPRPRHDPLRP